MMGLGESSGLRGLVKDFGLDPRGSRLTFKDFVRPWHHQMGRLYREDEHGWRWGMNQMTWCQWNSTEVDGFRRCLKGKMT